MEIESKYPIVPYEGEWGADVIVQGRPEYLPDGQVCSSFCHGKLWESSHSGMAAIKWAWPVISKIRLPASHGYYADNPEYGRVHTDGSRSGGQPAFNLDTWQSETKANLPAIEAAGHSVTFAPDWAEQLWIDLQHGKKRDDAIDLIRKTVRPKT